MFFCFAHLFSAMRAMCDRNSSSTGFDNMLDVVADRRVYLRATLAFRVQMRQTR